MTKTERLRALLTECRDLAGKAESEGRDLTAEERATIEAKLAEANTIKADVAIEDALKGFGDDVAAIDEAKKLEADGRLNLAGGKSIGDAFVNDERVKAWYNGIAPNGVIPESAKGITSPALSFPGLKGLGFKAPVTGASDTSAGALVNADNVGVVDTGAYQRPLTVLDLITRGTTGSDTVEYVREDTVTNAAAPVAEATTTGGADGTKPESAMALEKVSTAVKTIAHWIPATKRALSDAGQVRTLIDTFLRYGLAEELEDQIVTGDGTGENFTGILNVTGVQTQAFDTSVFGAADERNLLVTTRKAKTKVRTVGRAIPTAWVFHPNDVERFDLLKDANDAFYFGGPSVDGPGVLWRLPIVESEAITEGVGLIGDFRRMVIWDREQATLAVSDSHADFFIRNLVAILAELRAAFGVTRPAAFVNIDLTEL